MGAIHTPGLALIASVRPRRSPAALIEGLIEGGLARGDAQPWAVANQPLSPASAQGGRRTLPNMAGEDQGSGRGGPSRARPPGGRAIKVGLPHP